MGEMIFFAHRGLSDFRPENTLAAFRAALDQGAKAIELDVQLSRDGKLVVMHDFYLGRTNQGKGLILEKDYAELSLLDAGEWFDSAFTGERIPLLEEVFQIVPEDVLLNIEMKKLSYDQREDFAEKLVNLLHQKPRKVLISSFDHQLLKKVQELDASIPLGLLYCSNLLNIFDYIKANQLKLAAIHPSIEYVHPELVAKAHQLGIAVNVYTIKQQRELDLMRAWQVDGVFVNHMEGWQ